MVTPTLSVFAQGSGSGRLSIGSNGFRQHLGERSEFSDRRFGCQLGVEPESRGRPQGKRLGKVAGSDLQVRACFAGPPRRSSARPKGQVVRSSILVVVHHVCHVAQLVRNVMGRAFQRPIKTNVDLDPSLVHQGHAQQTLSSRPKRDRPAGKEVRGPNPKQRQRRSTPRRLTTGQRGGPLNGEWSHDLDPSADLRLGRYQGASSGPCGQRTSRSLAFRIKSSNHNDGSEKHRNPNSIGQWVRPKPSAKRGPTMAVAGVPLCPTSHGSLPYENSRVNDHSPWLFEDMGSPDRANDLYRAREREHRVANNSRRSACVGLSMTRRSP